MEVGKRKNNWYPNNYKKRKQFSLEVGMKGFLCTCNFREKDCIRDVYKLLNEFSDKLNSVEKSEDQEDEDISTTLSKEIDRLQAESAAPALQRKFQVMETGVKNVLFIQTTVPDPLKLAMSIIKDVFETKQQRSRFLLRLLPVEVVCKAFMNDLRSRADSVLEKYFSQEPKTFSIVFNRHSNSNLQRNDVIEDLANIITTKNPGNKADLKNPEIAVVVEAIRGVCLLSVAPNYMSYKKYNLLEMCNPTKQKDDDKNSGNTIDSVDSKEDINSSMVVKSEENVNELTSQGESEENLNELKSQGESEDNLNEIMSQGESEENKELVMAQ